MNLIGVIVFFHISYFLILVHSECTIRAGVQIGDCSLERSSRGNFRHHHIFHHRNTTNCTCINGIALDTHLITFEELGPQPGFFADQNVFLLEQYASLGIHFSGIDFFSNPVILDESGDFGVNGFSPPDFVACNSIIPHHSCEDWIKWTFDQPVLNMRIGVGSPFEGPCVLLSSNGQVATVFLTNNNLTYLVLPGPITDALLSCAIEYGIADNLSWQTNCTAIVDIRGSLGPDVDFQSSKFQFFKAVNRLGLKPTKVLFNLPNGPIAPFQLVELSAAGCVSLRRISTNGTLQIQSYQLQWTSQNTSVQPAFELIFCEPIDAFGFGGCEDVETIHNGNLLDRRSNGFYSFVADASQIHKIVISANALFLDSFYIVKTPFDEIWAFK